jgi:hypothetical protein
MSTTFPSTAIYSASFHHQHDTPCRAESLRVCWPLVRAHSPASPQPHRAPGQAQPRSHCPKESCALTSASCRRSHGSQGNLTVVVRPTTSSLQPLFPTSVFRLPHPCSPTHVSCLPISRYSPPSPNTSPIWHVLFPRRSQRGRGQYITTA